MKKILIVDDDAELRSSFGEVLRAEGYLTTDTASPIEALEMAGAQEFDVVLLDFMMPEMNGMDALIALKKLRPKIKVIMMTAFASVENAVEAVKKGVSDYLQKPF
ncbi:MAG TPA: response regulator, partial [Nitrospirota bacterium]